jgi:aspartyl-tRNA(Asn)/glutamyl-tRNA(Gln) amidotransferase subunit C
MPPYDPRMIEREQVEHVARLARLKLSDEEVERMASELSGILDHVERIGELDLDGVEPTSHVIALENVLRPDEPRPSWERDEMLERAPDPAAGAFRVPSPQA